MYKKYLKVMISIVVILFLQQPVFASQEVVRPLKPTEGIESSNLSSGISTDVVSIQTIDGLLTDWYCSISVNGTNLYLGGSQTACNFMEELRIKVFLQKWNGTNWIDVKSWTTYEYDSLGIITSFNTSFISGNYYRTRAEHYAKNGSQIDNKYSSSPYIYVQ